MKIPYICVCNIEEACRGHTISAIEDLDQCVNVTVDQIEFTAEHTARQWGLRPDDNAAALEDAAARRGISSDLFWSIYEPILNAAAEWKP